MAGVLPIRSGQLDRQLKVEKEEKKLSKRDAEACTTNKKQRQQGPSAAKMGLKQERPDKAGAHFSTGRIVPQQ
jgi:hypothetical protein